MDNEKTIMKSNLSCSFCGSSEKDVNFLIEGDEVTTDAGNDGLPDTGWSRKDIIAWLRNKNISTGSGYLTKTAGLKLVEEYLNPAPVEETLSQVEDTTETTGDEQ